MTFDKLKEFIELAKSSGVEELKYESNAEKYEVSFSSGKAAPLIMPQAQPIQTVGSLSSGSDEEVDDGSKKITSPFVGTFYIAPSPGAEPYAKVGDKVSPGKVLCIVEAMKIMNEIESDITGEIVEVCVENETFVEFGQTLFKIR
jgi:acetyl-CoA carboxylase biotin carboxyl carrier protein